NKPNTCIASPCLHNGERRPASPHHGVVGHCQCPCSSPGRHQRKPGAVHPPLPAYGCSKKSAEACLVTGTACCSGQCVDTVAGVQHCGGCNKACEHGRTCCGGRCVDLLFDKKNCGTCSNKCNKKCSYGFCDYAQ
uniref:Uncharacterized protein n=1 Tax=Aegilops tauschii subsp. strangulata TaxID=200361 RepID=A0A452ZGN6_AEGTS